MARGVRVGIGQRDLEAALGVDGLTAECEPTWDVRGEADRGWGGGKGCAPRETVAGAQAERVCAWAWCGMRAAWGAGRYG